MKRRACVLRAGAIVWALVGPPASRASGADSAACPSFAELGRRVDAQVAVVLALKPGLALGEFTSKYAEQSLNFWDDVGADKETAFAVGVTEGNAAVVDELVCRFDRKDRLRSCRHECCRAAARTITKAQYDSIAVGEARPEVERRLCSPSDVEKDKNNRRLVNLYYHIDIPVGHHDEGQTVLLVFEDGKLASKDMNPYY